MMQALLYIRVAAQQPRGWSVPLLETLNQEFPGLTTFDFDNFSEESIRQYGAELLKQSSQVAVVVEVEQAEAPISGLTSFFNRLLAQKPERLLLLLQGEQAVLHKMMKRIGGEQFYHQLPDDKMQEVVRNFFS